jgi:hypothetical protein
MAEVFMEHMACLEHNNLSCLLARTSTRADLSLNL